MEVEHATFWIQNMRFISHFMTLKCVLREAQAERLERMWPSDERPLLAEFRMSRRTENPNDDS
ncbi:hypothetical protein [Pseudomonas sp. BBP2017]|uniref:hypothetical protein n=1 Tax=Pseudomonas sp. BBP2017 TaxID=2109731 RepID=UPI000D12FFC0|nr:hypothetical protein [Pseudomonas sp. BBP2017]PSS58477.1 hypothetical protein C6382_03865 [Pseudomonas sp. BBP2017]